MIKPRLKRINHLLNSEKKSVPAVHDDDLVEFLKSIDAYKLIESGKAKCKFCGDVITVDNLESVFPESGAIKFVCGKVSCFIEFLDYQAEK